jgi:TRAP-type transport system small permease protein
MEVERLWRAYGALLQIFAFLAAGLIAVMLAAITVDVLLRNILVTGIRGIIEYTEFGLYLATILAAPWLLHQGQHIRADLLGQFGSGAWLNVADALADALGIAVSLAVGWYALQSAIESYAIGSMVRRTVEMPEWMLMAPLVLAMALLLGEFIFRLDRSIRRPGERRDDARSIA